MIDRMYQRYPFDECCMPYLKWLCRRYGVRQNAYLYQECFDAVMLSYLYSICRCSLLEDREDERHVTAYIKKLMKIYLIVAMTISDDGRNLCRENGFRQINCDDYRV